MSLDYLKPDGELERRRKEAEARKEREAAAARRKPVYDAFDQLESRFEDLRVEVEDWKWNEAYDTAEALRDECQTLMGRLGGLL